MKRLRDALQHMLNPLHVYCRLKDIGMPSPVAHMVSRTYERVFFRLLP
jgi:hypothetical protein